MIDRGLLCYVDQRIQRRSNLGDGRGAQQEQPADPVHGGAEGRRCVEVEVGNLHTREGALQGRGGRSGGTHGYPCGDQ